MSLTQTFTDKDEPYLDVTTDKDCDKLPDMFETAGMKCTNGQTLFSDSTTNHSDSDWLEDGQEVKMYTEYEWNSVPSYIQKYSPYKFIFTEISDPKNPDTDGDGLLDGTPTIINKEQYIQHIYYIIFSV